MPRKPFQTLPVGARYGRLVVLAPAQPVFDGHHNRSQSEFQCDCGTTVVRPNKAVLSGKTQSCGCFQKAQAGATWLKDLKGEIFGRLTVLERSGSSHGKARWLCRCSCARVVVISSRHLISGASQSCGCINQTSKSEVSLYNYLHKRDSRWALKVRGALKNPRFELDAFCPEEHKAVEVDGDYWHKLPGSKGRDTRKNRECRQAGISLLRIPEEGWRKHPGRWKILLDLYLMDPAIVVQFLSAVAPQHVEGRPTGIEALVARANISRGESHF